MSVGVGLSIGEVIACFAFSRVLSLMWILINALQLIVFLGIWQILYPSFLKVVLSELKRVSWGEFFDDIKIGEHVQKIFSDSEEQEEQE